MAEAKPGLVKFVFDYPYHIGVPSGFYYPVRLKHIKNAIGLIKVIDREGVQVHDKGFVQRPGAEHGPILEKVNGDPRVAEIVVAFEQGSIAHTIAGETGKVTYPWIFSEVHVIFAVDDIHSVISGPKASQQSMGMVYAFFNKFLSAYRNVSSDVRTQFLSDDDNITFYTLLYISELTDEEEKMGAAEILCQTPIKEVMDKREFVPYPMRGDKSTANDIPLFQGRHISRTSTDIKKPLINPGQLKTLLDDAGGLNELEPYRTMLLSGLERIGLETNYRGAIISFDTAVDMAIIFFLTILLKRSGKSPEEIEALYDETNSASRALQRQHQGFLGTEARLDRLEEMLNQERQRISLNAVSVRGLSEYIEWRDKTRNKRNKIVHAGDSFGKTATEEAFRAAQGFIRKIEHLMAETMPNQQV